MWYVLPMRIPLGQQGFRELGLQVNVGEDGISFPKTDLYLFQIPMSIYFRYACDAGKTTMIIQHAMVHLLHARFLESFENIDKLQYLDNPFRIHGIGVSYVLREWKRAMIPVRNELKNIVRIPLIHANACFSL